MARQYPSLTKKTDASGGSMTSINLKLIRTTISEDGRRLLVEFFGEMQSKPDFPWYDEAAIQSLAGQYKEWFESDAWGDDFTTDQPKKPWGAVCGLYLSKEELDSIKGKSLAEATELLCSQRLPQAASYIPSGLGADFFTDNLGVEFRLGDLLRQTELIGNVHLSRPPTRETASPGLASSVNELLEDVSLD